MTSRTSPQMRPPYTRTPNITNPRRRLMATWVGAMRRCGCCPGGVDRAATLVMEMRGRMVSETIFSGSRSSTMQMSDTIDPRNTNPHTPPPIAPHPVFWSTRLQVMIPSISFPTIKMETMRHASVYDGETNILNSPKSCPGDCRPVCMFLLCDGTRITMKQDVIRRKANTLFFT
jgi:hypothetical protein